MSLTILWQQTATTIGELVLDATLTESHRATAEATSNPVEDGMTVSDHLVLKPDEVTIEGFITNTPFSRGTPVSAPAGQPGRAASAYETLRRLRTAKQLVSLVTSAGKYDNMVMTSFTVPREPRVGESLRFSAEFRELVIVRTQTRRLPKTAKPRGQPRQEDGKKNLVATAEATRNKSILRKGAERFLPGAVNFLSR